MKKTTRSAFSISNGYRYGDIRNGLYPIPMT